VHAGHPVVVSTTACGRRLGGGPAHDGLFTTLVRAPELTGDSPPRPIPRPTSLRTHHCVPSSVHARVCFTGPHPPTSSGSVLALKTGSEFSLGIKGLRAGPLATLTREHIVAIEVLHQRGRSASQADRPRSTVAAPMGRPRDQPGARMAIREGHRRGVSQARVQELFCPVKRSRRSRSRRRRGDRYGFDPDALNGLG